MATLLLSGASAAAGLRSLKKLTVPSSSALRSSRSSLWTRPRPKPKQGREVNRRVSDFDQVLVTVGGGASVADKKAETNSSGARRRRPPSDIHVGGGVFDGDEGGGGDRWGDDDGYRGPPRRYLSRSEFAFWKSRREGDGMVVLEDTAIEMRFLDPMGIVRDRDSAVVRNLDGLARQLDAQAAMVRTHLSVLTAGDTTVRGAMDLRFFLSRNKWPPVASEVFLRGLEFRLRKSARLMSVLNNHFRGVVFVGPLLTRLGAAVAANHGPPPPGASTDTDAGRRSLALFRQLFAAPGGTYHPDQIADEVSFLGVQPGISGSRLAPPVGPAAFASLLAAAAEFKVPLITGTDGAELLEAFGGDERLDASYIPKNIVDHMLTHATTSKLRWGRLRTNLRKAGRSGLLVLRTSQPPVSVLSKVMQSVHTNEVQ